MLVRAFFRDKTAYLFSYLHVVERGTEGEEGEGREEGREGERETEVQKGLQDKKSSEPESREKAIVPGKG